MREITAKEFSPNIAGERVGWVSVQPLPGRDDVFALHLATASVSESGARHTYMTDGDDSADNPGRRLHGPSTDPGFENPTALSVLLSRDSRDIYPSNVFFSESSDSALQWGASSFSQSPLHEQKVWATSKPEIIELVKHCLEENELGHHYEGVYYQYNGRILHEGIRQPRNPMGSDSHKSEVSELILPDAFMAETTRSYLQTVHATIALYQTMRTDNETMSQNLTVFSAIPPNDVRHAYRASRLRNQEREKEFFELAKKAAKFPALLPFRGAKNRDWGDVEIFAQQLESDLASLKKEETGQAQRRLLEENHELLKRQMWSSQGAAALRFLNLAELA